MTHTLQRLQQACFLKPIYQLIILFSGSRKLSRLEIVEVAI